jgi:hypothetical protein
MAIFNSKLLNYQRVSITVRDYHILDQIPILVGLILFVSPKKKMTIPLAVSGSWPLADLFVSPWTLQGLFHEGL